METLKNFLGSKKGIKKLKEKEKAPLIKKGSTEVHPKGVLTGVGSKGFDPVTSYADVPYNSGFWALFDPAPNITPQQMHELHMKHGHRQYSKLVGAGMPGREGGLPNPSYDPTYVKPTRTPEPPTQPTPHHL